ncbi:MAG: DMT family transporter [Acidobacteria bacterium]|nr:DMT family transporter [Acidobacteriota bacterium]
MRAPPYLVLCLAVVFVSFGAIFVRLADAPALAVSFYRVALASLFLLPFAGTSARRSWPALSRRQAAILGGAGMALALHFATWIASLSYTSIASSVLLVNTAPVFAVVLSSLFLHERPSGVVVVAIPVAMVGAALIALGDHAASPGSLFGNLLALAGAVTVAAYQVIGRGLRAALPLSAYILGVWGTAALALGLLAAVFGVSLTGYPAGAWLAFVALALVPTIGGHGLANWSLRALPAPTVGLFLLGEPVGASLMGWLLFGEVPGPWTLVGGMIVLAALALVLTKRS